MKALFEVKHLFSVTIIKKKVYERNIIFHFSLKEEKGDSFLSFFDNVDAFS